MKNQYILKLMAFWNIIALLFAMIFFNGQAISNSENNFENDLYISKINEEGPKVIEVG